MYRHENNIIKINCDSSYKGYEGGLGCFCFDYMKKHGEKLAQILLSTNEGETYKTVLDKSIRTGITLQKMGIKKGDVIAYCSNTNLNSCIPLIASFLIGAIPAYVDTTFTLYDVTHIIKSVNPKLFLVTAKYLETIRTILKIQNRNVDNIVVYNEDFFKPQEEEGTFVPVYVEDLNETITIHFTSGTSGIPKGICINHYSLICANEFSFENLWVKNQTKVVLSFDSLYWSIEAYHMLCAIKEGVCRLIGSDESDIEKAWFYLEKYKVNLAYLIPSTIINMLESGKPDDVDLSNLTTIYIEGSLLPAKYHKDIQTLLPHVDIFHYYGQTEAGGITVFRKTDLHRNYNREKPGCVGVPIPGFGMSLKVVDLESGNILGPNKPGELHVKSADKMNGYHNLDNVNEFDEDGWLKTGDVVYYDEDFCFFIVDRVKDLILYQGWHIAPTILEAELLSHPAVKFAVVVGIPDEKNFEHAMGLVVLHDHFSSVTTIDIEKYVEERVPDNYRLRGGVKVIEESYIKNKNKIQRLKLKQLVMSGKI